MHSFLFVFLTVLLLGIYLVRTRRRGQKNTVNVIMTAAAGLHTLLILSNLAFDRPSNLFTRLRISIHTPVERIRSLLVKEAELVMMIRGAHVPLEIPKDIDTLLKRLGVQGNRETFARFGQRAMQTCPYCSTATDYTILVLAGILLDYLRTAALLLLLTTHINGRQRWRTNALGLLTCAFLAEAYVFTSASAVPLDKGAFSAFMWHDNLFLARHILFLVIPVFIQILPALYPPPPAAVALASALERLERCLARAHLLKYVRQAVLRHPHTRKRVVEFWANKATEGAAARRDPNVQATASKLGFGFAEPGGAGDHGQESVLRAHARRAVQALKPLFMPPPN